MSLSTSHFVLLDTPGRLHYWNMVALVNNEFLVSSHLILLKFFTVTLRLFFSMCFLQPCQLYATKRLIVRWLRLNSLAISRVLHPSERHFTIFEPERLNEGKPGTVWSFAAFCRTGKVKRQCPPCTEVTVHSFECVTVAAFMAVEVLVGRFFPCRVRHMQDR